jgi:two-component system CheB/CheR fusion protein
MLFEKLRLDRCYVGVYRLAEDIADFPHQVHVNGLPPLPAQVRLSDFPGSLRVAFERTLVVADAVEMEGLSDHDRASIDGLGMRAFVAATLRKGENNPLWAIVIGSARARNWTQGEVTLVEEVAERTWTAVERARAEVALGDSEARFRQFSDASSDILWIRNAETMRMEFASPAFDRIYGVAGPDRGGPTSLLSWARLIEPESRKIVLSNFKRVRAGERTEMEFRVRRASDGALRWIHCSDFPLRDEAGRVRWLAGLGSDITEAKETADRQNLLVAELQHRTRNLIAVVRSLVDRTIANTSSLEAFGERLRPRLAALSRVQGLLSNLTIGQRVTFKELLSAELAAHGAADGLGIRLALDGPENVPLRSATVQTFALALHELATNSVKYGALSGPSGHLCVKWHVITSSTDDERWLHVDWSETGADMSIGASLPRAGGYGRELIERALPYQLNARTSYTLDGEGVRCTIEVPISRSPNE